MNSKANTKNEMEYSLHGNGHPEDHYIERAQGAGLIMVRLGANGQWQCTWSSFGSMKSQSERVLTNCEMPCGSRGSVKSGSRNGVCLVATRWGPCLQK